MSSDSESEFITHELTEGDKLDHTTLHITLEVDDVEPTGGVHFTDHVEAYHYDEVMEEAEPL